MSGMGTSTQSSTEQSQTSYPQWTQDAQQQTYQAGGSMLENFLRNPQYAVAGMNTDQLKGFDLARDTARQAYTAPKLSAPGTPNLNAATLSNPNGMNAAQFGGAQLGAGDAQQFINPYLQNVADTTFGTLRRERDRTAADIGARAAAGNSFGGSREAVQRSLLDRNYNDQVGSTMATLMAQGFDKATATAMANTQLQQQTGLANAGFEQQANTTNAGMGMQTGLANMTAENAMRTTGADYGLKATQVNDTLRTTQQAREMSALQQIIQGGNQQQQFGQQALDVPWTMLQMLMGLTPQQMNSQTVGQKETESSQSPLSTILGAGTSLFGGGSGGIIGGIKGLLGG